MTIGLNYTNNFTYVKIHGELINVIWLSTYHASSEKNDRRQEIMNGKVKFNKNCKKKSGKYERSDPGGDYKGNKAK